MHSISTNPSFSERLAWTKNLACDGLSRHFPDLSKLELTTEEASFTKFGILSPFSKQTAHAGISNSFATSMPAAHDSWCPAKLSDMIDFVAMFMNRTVLDDVFHRLGCCNGVWRPQLLALGSILPSSDGALLVPCCCGLENDKPTFGLSKLGQRFFVEPEPKDWLLVIRNKK